MRFFFGLIFSVIFLGQVWAGGYTPNRAYLQSGCEGIFYARCKPAGDWGSAGTTEVYKVVADKDEVLDRYDFFAAGGVYLGWSPIVGKVALMALPREKRESPPPAEEQIEFSFYLGGKALRSWTTADLVKLGAVIAHGSGGVRRADFVSLGCRQVPGTNEYVFVIVLGNGDQAAKEVEFDILTGEVYGKKREG